MVDLPYGIDIKYCAIGGIVIQWGTIEDRITDCVLFLYHKCDGKNTKACIKAGMPKTQFSRKIEFLYEIFESPLLSNFKDEALSLICRAESFSTYRDAIIHSVIAENKPDSLKFYKYDYDKACKKSNKPKLKHFELTLDNLINLGNNLESLANDLSPFVHRLLTTYQTP